MQEITQIEGGWITFAALLTVFCRSHLRAPSRMTMPGAELNAPIPWPNTDSLLPSGQ